MDVDIKFCQSAFKHGICEADIRWAIDTVKYDGCLEDDEDAGVFINICSKRRSENLCLT
jgi:hypothetical protein